MWVRFAHKCAFTVKYIERDNQTGLWLQDELFSIRRRSMASFIEMKRSQHFKLHHVNGKKFPAWLTRSHQSRIASQLRPIFQFVYVPKAQTSELCYVIVL